MGKNRKSSGGGGATPTDYTTSNDQALRDYEATKMERSEKEQEYIELIHKFCEENNLEMINTLTNGTEVNRWDDMLAVVAFRDPETGMIFNVFPDAISDTGIVFGEIGIDFKKSMEESLKVMREFPQGFNHGVGVVNFVHEPGSYGYVRSMSPHSIQISPATFASPDRLGSSTGVGGVFAHELTHAWEINNHGHIGALTKFSELKAYPTEYARDTKNIWIKNIESPDVLDHELVETHGECIATVVEQVYSHKLRSDAIMKNGDSVATAFEREYGHAPRENNKSDANKMYDLYYNEWSELTNEVSNIIPAE